jgi:tetratricopeptide (TPR) repeat protein
MTELSADIAQAVNAGIAATDRGDYEGALRVFAAVYKSVPHDKMPDGLSAYGLCVARVEKKTKMGISLCEKAMSLQFYEGKHWANLVRLYISAKSRKKAVDILEKGLKKMPHDQALLRVREEIGYRQSPELTFLPRRNPINKFFSLYAARLARRSKIILIVIASLIYLGVVAAIFKLIVK